MSALHMEKITEHSKDFHRTESLYVRAFPENEPQRHLRRAFYLRNGYTPSEVRYIWQGEQYEILVSSGTITNTEFENFWDHFPNDEDR